MITKLEQIIIVVLGIILLIAKILKHQSTVDLDNKEDLKKLNSISDLFHVH